MAGHGSPPPADRGSHPGRQVGRSEEEWQTVGREIAATHPAMTRQQRDTRHLWDEDWAAEGRELNAQPREY